MRLSNKRTEVTFTSTATARRWSFSLAVGVGALLALGLHVRAEAAPNATDLASLSAEVRAWVELDDQPSARWIESRVDAGLPAGVLAVLADACAAHPRLDLLPVLKELSQYRRPEVRARALAARAELGGQFAVSAIEAAADDLDAGVRRVAVALAAAHPSAPSQDVVAKLLARDEELRDAQSEGAVPPAPPPAAEDEDDVVLLDEVGEEVPFNIVDPGTPLENPDPPPDLEVGR